jgi:DNA-3-methyladenine glycosylase II
MRELINTISLTEMESTGNLFHDLISCIIEQQIHYRSTKKIFQKMLIKADLGILSPVNFPIFELRALAGLKLSANKYETLSSVLEFWNNNEINWNGLSDEEVRQELSKIRGIGEWTIQMILLYTLQRPNAFAIDDFHIKQIMISLYGLNPKTKLKAQMVEITEKWSPYKSTAFRYLLVWKAYQKRL